MRYFPRTFAAVAVAFMFVGCTEGHQIKTVMRWERSQSTIGYFTPTPEGMYVLRRTAVRTAHEIYTPDGRLARQFFSDRPVTKVLVHGDAIYFVEEVSPGRGIIQKAIGSEPPVEVAGGGNWTELIVAPSGDVLAFESLFLSQDIPPSAVRVRNLTRGTVEFDDQFSYHYPFSGRALFLLSPIDRRLRIVENGRAREIGAITSLDFYPILSHHGDRIAWFGPNEMGSSLFVADSTGRSQVLLTPLNETPMTWLGRELAVAHRDELTARWILKRYDPATGLINGTFMIPPNVIPRVMLGSRSGKYLGLSTDYGSMLIRISDGFIEEFFDIPLSAWRFSDDESQLYFVEQDAFQVLKLR